MHAISGYNTPCLYDQVTGYNFMLQKTFSMNFFKVVYMSPAWILLILFVGSEK
jgi:hypothetical protein